MHRFFVLVIVAWCLLVSRAAAQAAPNPQWNDERTTALVRRATGLRQRQLADTGLVSYAASAHGYLTFLAQIGEGFTDPPKIVKADELALEVYWRAPNYSKQWIVGRRDTLVLPTDIQYHRDHLGIVQNNFPQIIRLGEGDEVRDVPHPLSRAGLATYDFAITDSLSITIPGRKIDVYEVKLRPRHDDVPAAVGAVYVAKADAQVVRMAFSFTRAALLDKELEDVSIVLENALIEGRFWLPRRQEIEIRRTGTWLDFPARGIIRGRWEICCYHVNQGQPVAFFAGPEIVMAPPDRLIAHRWEGAILDSLPADVRAATDEDVRRVQAEARALVREAALARSRQTSVSARSLSDALRVNRAEGLSLGAGVRHRLGKGFDALVTARYGTADHVPKGSLGLAWEKGSGDGARWQVYREYRDVSDELEGSGVRNSIAAQEFGTDDTDPIDARGLSFAYQRRDHWAGRWQLVFSYEWQDSVSVAARPTLGSYEPTIPAEEGHGPRVALRYERTGATWAGFQLGFRGEVRTGRLTASSAGTASFKRAFGAIQLDRTLGAQKLALRALGGVATSHNPIPPQEYLFAGGPVTAPGYVFHSLSGRRLLALRADWQIPVPFVPVSLGRWGRIPGRASIVPIGSTVYVARSALFRMTETGWYPSLGVGLIAFFDLLRIDAAKGLRDGRWSLNVDISRDFWRIM